MASKYLYIAILLVGSCNFKQTRNNAILHKDPIRLSQNLLEAVREKKPVAGLLDTLKRIDLDGLSASLNTDTKRKVFWLNIYNANIQLLLSKEPHLFEDRVSFFSSPRIGIGDEDLSLDEIEHDLLRRSKVKYSKGYLNKLFKNDFEDQFRVDTVDFRIHFALNCGAKSCPPVKFYEAGHLSEQLDLATREYLHQEVVYEPLNNSVTVPALMDWFKNDFGGNEGILKILRQLNIIPAVGRPKILFKGYDWTLELNNFKMES